MNAKKRIALTLLILIIISFSIRIAFISDCLFHHDSIELSRAVMKTIETKSIHPAVGGKYGFVLINTLSYLLFRNIISDIDYILNLTTIIFASLSIGILYLFIKKLTSNNRLAILTSILFSLNPLFLSVTVYAKSHALAFFFAILSAYCLLKYIETGKLSDKIIFIIIFAYSFSIRNTNLYYAFPFLVLTLLFKAKHFKLKNRLINLSLPIAISIILYFILNTSFVIYEASANKIILNDLGQMILLFYFSIEYLYSMLTILGIFILVLTIYAVIKVKKYRHILLFSLIWFLPYYLIISLIPTSSARFFIPILLPLMLSLSIGIEYVYSKNKALSIILVIFLLMLFAIKVTPIISFRHNYCAPKEFALFAKNMTEEGSYIISNDEGSFINYYANRKTIGYPKFADKTQLSNTLKRYYSLLKNNKTLYATGKILFMIDSDNSSYKTLNQNFILEYKGSALNEDYHHSEFSLKKRNESLYQIKLNPGIPFEEFRVFYYIEDTGAHKKI